MSRMAVVVALVILLAPAMAPAQSVGLFTVFGKVKAATAWKIQVENEMVDFSLQSSLLSEFATETYSLVFTDFETNRAASLGDQFRIVLLDANDVEIKVNLVAITQENLDSFGVQVDLLKMVSVESKTWTAIRALYR